MAKPPTEDAGFGRLIGIEMLAREDGRSRCRLTVRPEVLNPHGVLHGGAMYSLADQGMGAAVYSRIDPEESCATIEIKVVYMAPVLEGSVECASRVIHKGKRVAVLESDIENNGRLVAKALGTFAIFATR